MFESKNLLSWKHTLLNFLSELEQDDFDITMSCFARGKDVLCGAMDD